MDAIDAIPDWRDRLTWPVPPDVLEVSLKDAVRQFLSMVEDAPDEDVRSLMLLAAAGVLPAAMDYLYTAVCVDQAHRQGLAFGGTAPELDFLASGTGNASAARGMGTTPRVAATRGHHPAIISPWVTRKWASSLSLVGHILAPNNIAVSVNPLLIDAAANCRTRVRYWPAEEYLRSVRRSGRGDRVGDDVDAIAESIGSRLADVGNLREPIRSRLKLLVVEHAKPTLTQAARDLAGLAGLRRLPTSLWSGSGGSYPARALGLEVLRRGGAVTRFDHAGTLGLTCSAESAALGELSVSTKFVSATPALAANIESSGARDLVARYRHVALQGHKGDPSIRRLPLMRTGRCPKSPPCVVYAPTLVWPFGKHASLTIPPLVYLDWQLRLATMLAEMPIQLLCKPHPGGFYKYRSHPLETIAPTSRLPFEEVIDRADIFVMDRCTTTVFWQAICSDRPLVFIKLGPPELHPSLEREFAERCRIIEPEYDGRTLPRIQKRELEQAILDHPGFVDASAFRELLIGDPRRG